MEARWHKWEFGFWQFAKLEDASDNLACAWGGVSGGGVKGSNGFGYLGMGCSGLEASKCENLIVRAQHCKPCCIRLIVLVWCFLVRDLGRGALMAGPIIGWSKNLIDGFRYVCVCVAVPKQCKFQDRKRIKPYSSQS
jgi:hypothetical protein